MCKVRGVGGLQGHLLSRDGNRWRAGGSLRAGRGRRDGRATGQPLRPRPEGLREPWGRVKDSVPRGARSVWRHPPNPAGPLLLSLVAGWPTADIINIVPGFLGKKEIGKGDCDLALK